ncbi:MAG TPA: hypothetical protein VLJ42_00375 [Solirubrobacteraceae bacterium]|nr:hypothetical protein [Solirubrobacteraceae bacterium]
MASLPARPIASLALLLTSASFMLAACGSPTRSTASYCSYFYGQGAKLRQRWVNSSNQASQDPFSGLATVLADLPEAASFFRQLSLRAPEDIAPDVQTLADSLQRSVDQAGSAAANPLAALAGGLAGGLASSGAEQRVNTYTEQNCVAPPGVGGT